MSQVTQGSQIRYISNGPLDAKAYVSSKSELSGFTSAEKYVGMTVIVGNEKTTKIPEEYWLVGGIGKNKWVKKAPNFQLKVDEIGNLSLVLEDGASDGSDSSVDIKQFIAEQTGDIFVRSGSLLVKNVSGSSEAFIRLDYNDETIEPVYINVSGLLNGGINLDDYYTKEETDDKFFSLIVDPQNNALEYDDDGLGMYIYGDDVEI